MRKVAQAAEAEDQDEPPAEATHHEDHRAHRRPSMERPH